MLGYGVVKAFLRNVVSLYQNLDLPTELVTVFHARLTLERATFRNGFDDKFLHQIFDLFCTWATISILKQFCGMIYLCKKSYLKFLQTALSESDLGEIY